MTLKMMIHIYTILVIGKFNRLKLYYGYDTFENIIQYIMLINCCRLNAVILSKQIVKEVLSSLPLVYCPNKCFSLLDKVQQF